jgi:hypothetical protein
MVRTLEDIFDICGKESLQVMPVKVALAQFDVLNTALDSRWRDVLASLDGLERLMPGGAKSDDPVVVGFGGVRLYQSCRSALLKLIVSIVSTENSDSFRILRILWDEAEIGSGLSDLKVPLERAFGEDVKPREITRELAIAADAPFSGSDRERLRRAFVVLDRLRRIPKVLKRGLLLADPIGRMPKYGRDGRLETPFPPRLAVFCGQLMQNQQVALRAVYHAALIASLFEGEDDIVPSCLIEPETLAKISEHLRQCKTERTSQIYLARVIKAVLDYERCARHPDAWEELKRVARRAGCTAPLDPLHFLKIWCVGCAPYQVSQERFDEILRNAISPQNRLRLQKAGVLLNELRTLRKEDLQVILPTVNLRIFQRKRKAVPKSQFLPPDPWYDRMKLAISAGLCREELNAIGAVRQRASKDGLGPRDITHAWACDALDSILATSSRARFRRGVDCLDAMRASVTSFDLLPLTDLGPLPDKRRNGMAKLPDRLVGEIQAHATFRGLSHNARRAILTAITSVFNHTQKKEMFEMPLAEIPLSDIVEATPSCAGPLPKNWHRTCAVARQLEKEVSLQWERDWADLQRLVVSAGVPVKENPVPAIAIPAQNSGLTPTQIDREWAWQHGRVVMSRSRCGLSVHLCGLSFKCQGAFET